MIDEKKYIGLELAKKLYINRLKHIESNVVWIKRKDCQWYLMDSEQGYKTTCCEIYPAYSYEEIFTKYVDCFFNINDVKIYKVVEDMIRNTKNGTQGMGNKWFVGALIWKYCKFNKENEKR